MTLQFIDLDQLSVSPLNVRKFGAKECDDLVSSIRALGMLQPLLVRPFEDGFEVIAGQRRLNACRIIAEDGEIDPIPCLVMAEGDDAAALEASLAENIERLPMDEVDQYKAFAKLIKEGRDADDIAATFGITPRMVSQRLALGRLHPPILTAYRKGAIQAGDIRNLTMATPKQQKDWWALMKDEDAYAPTGQRLKDWLFGGAHIPTANAVFDVLESGLAVVSDLFSEDSYFADAEAFWTHQNTAIAEAVDALKADGWADVILMDRGNWFANWDHRSCAKEDGGKVFVTVTNQGEVTSHKGYITKAEAKRREKADITPAEKPELTKAAQNYVDLHRHAAVRSDMLVHQGLALRLIAAHMICGARHWTVSPDLQIAAKPEIEDSLATNSGQTHFDEQRFEITKLLGLDDLSNILYNPEDWDKRKPIWDILDALKKLSDEDVLRILTFLMAESLDVNSPMIEQLGEDMGTDMSKHWQPDETFLALIRDKQVLNAMVGEFAGTNAAAEHITATAKTQRALLTACMDGTRKPVDPDWMPRYMAFPQGSYREAAVAVETEDTMKAA
ncbi:Chromosome-partitioning protein Spo0J [Pelagimonas phthalicica]|uniref:Chromosome-partitioning protein Spo0J n=1 Tax=Pelagimonas phthalicica TaxID=1037362 RepID=A0A238JCW1_9RHOB|nr:ParB/RepB/Spo0J family partition protein [Pelagimonas phthalicica]TDS91176.1 ParB family chromosome partitioning protein [Pelagimonas phthalicica]SMX28223.1 Chromosome-partitioning protein Spo0J [Pelagimonas phthalicica]